LRCGPQWPWRKEATPRYDALRVHGEVGVYNMRVQHAANRSMLYSMLRFRRALRMRVATTDIEEDRKMRSKTLARNIQ
jgi:hypothetical protein